MSPCIDILVNFAGGVATNVVTVVVKEARYCWEFNTLVKDMGDEQELLKSISESMQVQVRKALANSRKPAGDIALQLNRAADLLKNATKLQEKAEGNFSSCEGVFPKLICRYIIGKQTEKITNKMKQLKDYLQPWLDFAHRSSLQAMSVPEDFILFETTKEVCDEIITALKDNTKKKIGLYGMGGCGKSSMLKLVLKEVQDGKLFDRIAFVEVSDPPNIPDIQQDIADWFDLDFEREMHKHTRATRLSMAFEEDKSYLVILDNVWKMLKFDDIGIPFHKNCKVLLSTRQREKCNLMGCQKVIPLPLLTKEEAWTLFQQHAGVIKDRFKREAEKISTDNCQGLPVAIKAVASTLKDKPEFVWEEALTMLKNRRLLNVDSEEDNPYTCLKFSFKELKDKEEISLFLLCALFPNDSELTLETLIRFAFGLGIFQDVDSYQRARSRVPTVIHKFKDSCLLLQEKGQYIKMHDMFRAVALSEANEKTQVITGPSQNLKDLDGKNYLKETTRLYCHGTDEFPDQLNSPELEILHMSNDNGYSSKFPRTFFKEMIKLKVLSIKNTSRLTIMPTLLLPQSIEGLKELRTLCLNGWAVDNMSCFETLEMLDSIELSYCEIKELPKELATMKKLKLLEVSWCRIGGNPYKVLARCSQLEELYFVKNFVPKMVSNDQNVAELIEQIASSQVLQRYRLEVGSSADAMSDDLTSKYISINNFDISILNKAIQHLAQKLEVLFLEKVQGDCTSITPGLIPSEGEYMDELTEFILRDFDSIECLIDATKHQLLKAKSVFFKLEKLKIEAMKGMKAVCIGPPPRGLLMNLKVLVLKHCGQLVSLGKLELLNLESMELEDCPKLTSFFTAATAQKMKMLQVLKVRGCFKLKRILKDEKEEYGTPEVHVFPNLKHVTVKECNNLECIIPASFAGGLSQLASLEIENAAALTHVFGKSYYETDQNQSQHIINLPVLEVFRLIGLPSMIRYCPQNYDIEWPSSLGKPYIVRCPLLSSMSEPPRGVEAKRQGLKINAGYGISRDLVRVATQKARFNTLVTDLKNERDKLLAQIREVKANTVKPSGNLQQQLNEAEHVIEKVKKLESKAEARKWICQFIVGKRLATMTETMKQLNERLAAIHLSFRLQTDHKDKSSSVLDSQTKAPYHSSSSEDFMFFESTKKASDELLMALKDDHINIIGLYGMAGCGKTSLVMEVCNDVKGLKLFDDVIYVTVSPYANDQSVRATIAEWLGLLLMEESEVGKAARLRERLKMGGRFLLVLDDMWSVLDLEKIGIPVNENCKVILTTGLRHTFPLMSCRKEVYLSLLTKDEAWILFQMHVGVIEDEIVARGIVEECQGLPVAIVAIAKALKGKEVTVWKEASKELGDSTALGFGSEQEMVYQSLKLSVDELQDQARSLFLLCALFPKDSKISPEILTRFAFGLSIFGNVDSYQRARDIVHEAINEMNNSCLLLQSKGGHFHMHNLVLKAALWVAKETRVIMGHKEKIKALIKRGLMEDISRLYCHDINKFPYQLNCPKLELLVVSNDDRCSSEFPETFFTQMTELKVLAIIDTSVLTSPNLLLPQSIGTLKKLRTLCFRGWTLGNISFLVNLEMLDTIELLYCEINELPKELVELKKLKLLEISGSKMGGNPFDVLARCSQLEELYFIENNLQEVESNDQNVMELFHQIGTSKVLQKYQLEIGSSIDILKHDATSKFISINGFNVSTANEAIKNLAQKLEVFYLEKIQGDCRNIIPDMIPANGECMTKLTEFFLHDSDNIKCLIDTTNYELYHTQNVFSRLLKLRIKSMNCLEVLCRGPPPFNLFEKLEELFIVESSQLHCIVSGDKLNLCNLKCLQLEDCPKLTSVFTYATARTMVLLEVLKVRDCNALKQIIKDEEEDDIISLGPLFPQLKGVSVKGCEHMEFIIPASFAGFLELESLEIEDAGELKYIFGIYNHEKRQRRNEIQIIIDLPVLKVLKLTDLPNITNICPKNCHITWPHAVKAYIRRCPLLSSISDLDSIVSQQDGDKFTKEELELEPKHSSEVAGQSVESIHLEDCEMENIFQYTQPAAINMESNSLLLSSLQSLALNNLPHVRYICEGHKQLFSLRRVKIYKCGELKCIFSLRMMTYISSLRELVIEDCSELEQIIEDEDYDSRYTGPFNNNYNLERITIKSCPMLRSLFSVSTAETLRLIRTLKIEGCHGMEVLMNEGSIETYSSKETREDHGQAILPELSYLSLKYLPRLIEVREGDKCKTVKGVLFPESFNLSNLQRLTVKSCPRLRSLFTESTAKTLTWLYTLQIEECFELEYVIKGESKEISQGCSKDLVPRLKILRLVKLPNLIIFYRGIRLRCELFRVRDCPNLKQTIAAMLEPEDLPNEYESPRGVVYEAVIANSSAENYSLSSHATLTYSKKGKGVATATSKIQVDNHSGVDTSNSSFHLLKQDGISALAAAENHTQSQESIDADAPRRLSRAEEESLHKDPAPEESKVGTSSLDLIARQPLVVKDPKQAHEKYKAPLPVHPTMLSPSTSVTTTPTTIEASTSFSMSNQHPSTEESVDFHGLFKIEARQALFLEEAFEKIPQLREWMLSQNNIVP